MVVNYDIITDSLHSFIQPSIIYSCFICFGVLVRIFKKKKKDDEKENE